MLYYYDSVSDCADSDGGVGGVWLSECELGYNHNNNSSRKWTVLTPLFESLHNPTIH